MRSIQTSLIAGIAVAATMAAPAGAADMPMVYKAAPVVVEQFSGWYLRGFIGMSNQFVNDISHPSFATALQFVFLDKGGFDSAPFFGGGDVADCAIRHAAPNRLARCLID